MAFNKDNFIKDLKEMSVLELNELVKTIEEEFGVSAAAPVAVAAAGAEEAGASDAKKTVILKDAGSGKMAVIKAIRGANPDLGLKDAKEIADNGGEIKADLPAEEADALVATLEEAGATVEVK
ncbi:MAG: 50S ribosomal protein L7/L12 [Mycoplasmatales bacterium]